MNITKWLEEAKQEAENSTVSEWSIGAIIVRGSQIIGRGYNRFSADVDRFRKQFDINEEDLWSLHAEMDAIQSIDEGEGLHNAIMFVSGFKEKNGNSICCKPCQYCMKVIQYTPIREVFYSDRGEVKVILL
jgi:deoxycytidylate deaminase